MLSDPNCVQTPCACPTWLVGGNVALLFGDWYMYTGAKRCAKRMRSRTTVDLGYRVIYDRDDSKDVDVRYVFALSVTLMPVRGLE